MDAATHTEALERAEYVASLRALADFIEANPHLELSHPDSVSVFLMGATPADFAPDPSDVIVTRRTDYEGRPFVAVERPLARFAAIRDVFNDPGEWDRHVEACGLGQRVTAVSYRFGRKAVA